MSNYTPGYDCSLEVSCERAIKILKTPSDPIRPHQIIIKPSAAQSLCRYVREKQSTYYRDMTCVNYSKNFVIENHGPECCPEHMIQMVYTEKMITDKNKHGLFSCLRSTWMKQEHIWSSFSYHKDSYPYGFFIALERVMGQAYIEARDGKLWATVKGAYSRNCSS